MTVSKWLEQRPGGWERYQEGMIALSRPLVDEAIAKVKLPPNARRLLDVGGGHGLYSIKFCYRYPELEATIFDLPLATETTRKNIAAENNRTIQLERSATSDESLPFSRSRLLE